MPQKYHTYGSLDCFCQKESKYENSCWKCVSSHLCSRICDSTKPYLESPITHVRLSQFPGHSCFCPWVILCMFYCYRGVAEVKSKDPEFLTKVGRK